MTDHKDGRRFSVGDFSREPEDDPLQLAGDLALEALKVSLSRAGIGVDAYSVVITIEHGDAFATILHLTGEPEDDGLAALEAQLLHANATARELGLRVCVMPLLPAEARDE